MEAKRTASEGVPGEDDFLAALSSCSVAGLKYASHLRPDELMRMVAHAAGLAIPVRIEATIQKASSLPALDKNGLSDPFVDITVHEGAVGGKGKHSKLQRTKVIPKNLNPTWNENFDIADNLSQANASHISFSVWDKDKLSNDFAGEHNVQLAAILRLPGHRMASSLQLYEKGVRSPTVVCVWCATGNGTFVHADHEPSQGQGRQGRHA